MKYSHYKPGTHFAVYFTSEQAGDLTTNILDAANSATAAVKMRDDMNAKNLQGIEFHAVKVDVSVIGTTQQTEHTQALAAESGCSERGEDFPSRSTSPARPQSTEPIHSDSNNKSGCIERGEVSSSRSTSPARPDFDEMTNRLAADRQAFEHRQAQQAGNCTACGG